MSTDQEIFDSAVAPEPTPAPTTEPQASPEPQPSAVETTGGRLKDSVTGKFVAKGEQPPAPKEPPATLAQPQAPIVEQPEATMPAQVPSWRLAEETQRRREAEEKSQASHEELRRLNWQVQQLQQQVAKSQTPTEPIDPFQDPEGFANRVQGTVQEQLKSIRLENSLQMAQYAHKDGFDKAYAAFIDHAHRTRDAATYSRVMNSPNPGEAMVQWHKEQETLRELGGTDVKSWLEKQKGEWLKDPATQAQAIEAFKASQGNGASPPQQQIQLPPSLSRHASAAHASGGAEDLSDQGLYSFATAKR